MKSSSVGRVRANIGALSLRQLRAFVTVAESANFSSAAQAMHLTPSAVSVLIKTLEQVLGARLFDRSSRQLEITAIGREMLPAVRRVLGDLQHAVDRVDQTLARDRGRVAIATTPWLASRLLPESLARFRRSLPGIELALLDVSVARLADSVIDGEADIAVGTLDAARTEVRSVDLHQDALMLAVPFGHRLAASRSCNWKELEGEPLIAMTRGSGIRRLSDEAFTSIGLTVKPSHEVNQVSSAIALVRAGLGVAALPAFTLVEVDARRIVTVALQRPRIVRQISLITNRLRTPTPAASAMLEHLQHDLPPHLAARQSGRSRT